MGRHPFGSAVAEIAVVPNEGNRMRAGGNARTFEPEVVERAKFLRLVGAAWRGFELKNRDRILEFIERFPGRDDDKIAKGLGISPRQTVNQVCRTLAAQGVIDRRLGPDGKLVNFLNSKTRASLKSSIEENLSSHSSPIDPSDATAEWFWEGNVTDMLETYFREKGWKIISKADTRIRARGVDLHVEREQRQFLIEAKGYPAAFYRDPRRAAERKRTNPALQAVHWYSGALLKAICLRDANPEAIIGMAFPDFPKYRELYRKTKAALIALGIVVLFVAESGFVELQPSAALLGL
jgi:hypothetical protein